MHHLKELNGLIGMTRVKQSVADHVLYMAQGLSSDEDIHHIVLTGDPGSGKSTLAVIIGKIFAGLGLLEYGNVITVTRADMIGEHLGSTSIKTERVLETCIGNVMLIDEVYSFGCEDKRDSFSKECLDCINQFLSEHRSELLCIIAGYKQDIKDCVFSVNKGLERRFPWCYELDKYTVDDLKLVFESQVTKDGWKFDDDGVGETMSTLIFVNTNRHLFGNSGGDTEILFTRCKIAHSARLFREEQERKRRGGRRRRIKCLNENDVRLGFSNFTEYKKTCATAVSFRDQEKFATMYC